MSQYYLSTSAYTLLLKRRAATRGHSALSGGALRLALSLGGGEGSTVEASRFQPNQLTVQIRLSIAVMIS